MGDNWGENSVSLGGRFYVTREKVPGFSECLTHSGVAICMRGQPGCALANGGSISHKKSQPDTI